MLQPDHSSLLPAAGSCSLQRCSQREASARWHVVEHVRLRRQRPAGGRLCGGRPAAAGVVAVTAAAAAAGIPTLSALQLGGAGSQVALEQQQQQGQEEQLPAGLDLSLAENDADIVGFLYRQYNLCERRQARTRAERALQALQAADGSVQALSLERDVVPKLELLEALSPGLGWKVFRRYPEEFASPDALECWRVLAAFLFTTVGIPPEQVSAILARNHCLFRHAVVKPDSLRRLFEWLRRDLALPQATIVRLLARCPLILQADVDGVLKGRVQFLLDLDLTLERAVIGITRSPEVLGVDSALLAAKAEFYQRELGLGRGELGALYVREPTTLLASLDRLQATAAWLRAELGLDGELLRKVVSKGGVTKYPLHTLQERVAYWHQHLGFSMPELRQLLDRLPRLLLYPVHEHKYQLKLRFLTEELGLPLRPTLLAFPQYLTYSLPARIAPRAAAAAALGARRLPLTQLAVGEAAWVRWLRVPPEEWWAFEEQWQGSPQAQRWAAAADT